MSRVDVVIDLETMGTSPRAAIVAIAAVALVDTCNTQHVLASVWIANPSGTPLDEHQAARIYGVVDAWPTPEVSQ